MNLALRHYTRTAHALAGTALLASLLLAGCRIDTHKNGDNDNVDIGTPFGSMHVKTNNAADTSAIGLTAYPGAVVLKEHDGRDSDAADINMSFGSFHLGVQAASYLTHDPQDKVLTFYRKDLARYGDVIECRGNNTVGQPTRTSQGLTCSDNDHHHVSTYIPDDNLELRAGSQQHQHIVGIEPKDGGIKIGLVALELPSHLSDHAGHESKDVE
jgi:hypothetical protein